MPVADYCCHARLAAAAIFVIVVAACGGQATTGTSNPSTSMASPAATTARATSTASGPMTGDELVWLEGISALHKRMDKVLTNAPPTITEAMMREFGKELADCTPTFDRLGSATDRLQPVSDLAKQACAEYEKAAKCFAVAKDCGFDAVSKGSDLFARAEAKGFEIKDAAQ